jgi:hypothetical protein
MAAIFELIERGSQRYSEPERRHLVRAAAIRAQVFEAGVGAFSWAVVILSVLPGLIGTASLMQTRI